MEGSGGVIPSATNSQNAARPLAPFSPPPLHANHRDLGLFPRKQYIICVGLLEGVDVMDNGSWVTEDLGRSTNHRQAKISQYRAAHNDGGRDGIRWGSDLLNYGGQDLC